MKYVSRFNRSVNAEKRRAEFARLAAAEEFGGWYWGWREWDDFVDFAPRQVERLRAGVSP